MYGYTENTVIYWAIEAIVTLAMAVVISGGIVGRFRWCAWVYPVGQALMRVAVLVWQPTEFGYEPTMEQTALLLGLCVFSILSLRHPWWGWVLAFGSVWMLLMTLPAGVLDMITYFSYGHELIYLGLQVIASVLLHVATLVYGILFGLGRLGGLPQEATR